MRVVDENEGGVTFLADCLQSFSFPNHVYLLARPFLNDWPACSKSCHKQYGNQEGEIQRERSIICSCCHDYWKYIRWEEAKNMHKKGITFSNQLQRKRGSHDYLYADERLWGSGAMWWQEMNASGEGMTMDVTSVFPMAKSRHGFCSVVGGSHHGFFSGRFLGMVVQEETGSTYRWG